MNAIHIRKLKLKSRQDLCVHEPRCAPAEHVVERLLPVLRGRRGNFVLAVADLSSDGRVVESAVRVGRKPCTDGSLRIITKDGGRSIPSANILGRQEMDVHPTQSRGRIGFAIVRGRSRRGLVEPQGHGPVSMRVDMRKAGRRACKGATSLIWRSALRFGDMLRAPFMEGMAVGGQNRLASELERQSLLYLKPARSRSSHTAARGKSDRASRSTASLNTAHMSPALQSPYLRPAAETKYSPTRYQCESMCCDEAITPHD